MARYRAERSRRRDDHQAGGHRCRVDGKCPARVGGGDHRPGRAALMDLGHDRSASGVETKPVRRASPAAACIAASRTVRHHHLYKKRSSSRSSAPASFLMPSPHDIPTPCRPGRPARARGQHHPHAELAATPARACGRTPRRTSAGASRGCRSRPAPTGICCAKLGEAEVFAEAGIADIRLPYPVHPSKARAGRRAPRQGDALDHRRPPAYRARMVGGDGCGRAASCRCWSRLTSASTAAASIQLRRRRSISMTVTAARPVAAAGS